jgi:hypothetical protein
MAELGRLRASLGEGGNTAAVASLQGIIADGEVAAAAKNADGVTGALARLKPYAEKVLGIAKDIGVDVAAAAIKSSLGLS